MASFSGSSKTPRKGNPSAHQHLVSLPFAGADPQSGYRDDDEEENVVLSAHDGYDLGNDENVDQRVHLAQERLSRLRKEAEEIEREKVRLEELRRKQQAFMQGRTEMADRLSRAMASLDRESQDSRRKIEQMIVMRDMFAEHLESVNSLTPEDWSRQELPTELTRALGVIEDARVEYDRCASRLQALTLVPAPMAAAPTGERPAPLGGLPLAMNRSAFKHWAFCGLAFSAPLIIIGLLGLLVLLFR